MKTRLLAALLIAAAAHFAAPSTSGDTGPYVNGKFRGRIAYSADGNHNDPDDWAASPVALAIFANSGLKDRLVHFDYNCILPLTDATWEKTHAESVLGAAERYGYDKSLFIDCRQDLDGAISGIARAINESSADNPLYFIIAGPMEVPYLGIQQSQPDKRKFVYCVSHSRWNDGFATSYKFTHTKRSVISQGVHWMQIQDQNRLLSLSPYGKPAPAESWAGYHWMRDSRLENVRFLWERMQISKRPDPSDAGMAYFLATGDEEADPVKLQKLIDDGVVPSPAVRKRVRLEAENFRELDGFEVEDASDRSASHRLQVKSMGGAARIRTLVDEPYYADGRYDLDVRYMALSDKVCRFSLLVTGMPRGDAWEASTANQWTSQIIRDIEIRSADVISIEVQGAGARIDFVQLVRR